jgi:hypothetical protein
MRAEQVLVCHLSVSLKRWEEGTELMADERLLAAAKTDNEGLFEEAIDEVEDVNYADG